MRTKSTKLDPKSLKDLQRFEKYYHVAGKPGLFFFQNVLLFIIFYFSCIFRVKGKVESGFPG